MSEKVAKKSLFLVDGSSFLYRAYYGLRPLHTSKGMAIHAVYGFCRMIKKLLDTYDVGHIVLVWDSKGKSDRHEIYPEYKQTRDKAPSDIFEQKEYIQEFADLIEMEQLSKSGAEADDLMYSLAKKANKSKYQAIIVSSDKDMRQAITDNIITLDPFKDSFMDVAGFQERYGFEVSKLPFYFALLGDASDNIPGVKGVGKKGAKDLVQQFDSLQDLYDNIDQVEKERTKKLLLESKENAFLSEKLFLLKEYDVATKLSDVVFDEKNWQKALPLFQKLEFKSLIKDIEKNYDSGASKVEKPKGKALHELYNFILVDTQELLDQLCEQLKEKKEFAFDTETTGLDPMSARLVGMSICFKEGEAYYIPCDHQVENQQTLFDTQEKSLQQLSKKNVFTYLKPILENQSVKKYLHNAKYDQLVLLQEGIDLQGVLIDTMIAASLLSQEWEKKGLKELSIQHFDEEMLSYQSIVKKHKAKDFSYVPLQEATWYAAADAHQTWKLAMLYTKELQEQDQEKLFYDIELPVNDVLVAMQQEGIYCDSVVLDNLDKQISQDLNKIETEIHDLVGHAVNLNSPKQVKELLFDELGLTPGKKSAKGKTYSTDAQVLKRLTHEHPVPGMILKYRELFKLKSTYVEALPTYINKKTNRIHTSWNQTLVATGRLSSSNPNLQNIPKDTKEYGTDVRSAFKPKKGWSFISADYSQIELRILAHFSQDKNLVDAFLHDKDIHTQTAAKLFDVKDQDVTDDQRSIGKRINFSILYGLTPYGLSRDMGISFAEAKKYIEVYFEQYPGVQKWMEEVVEKTKANGYTETLFGRRRYVSGIHERNKTLYELARRIAINTPAQGTAAEITKLGMIIFYKALDKSNLQGKILLQIHDELLVSCPDDELEETQKLLKKSLESAVSWKIPLLVSTKTGKNWRSVTK
ncbi:MAG: DNA polymerase I [Epsilonproteobacteria bacterium]|nr:DNA polymerase I [Campylobacterota bacterium]